MYVRLAFAVAAHLDPDILIVDEVLAVGDAAFQKKCLGKMRDVAGQGRTVLFVSHSMAAVQSLCNKGVLMKGGSPIYIGDIQGAVQKYGEHGLSPSGSFMSNASQREGRQDIRVKKILISNGKERKSSFRRTEELNIEIQCDMSGDTAVKRKVRADINLLNDKGEWIVCASGQVDLVKNKLTVKLGALDLYRGIYTANISLLSEGVLEDFFQDAFAFEVLEDDGMLSGVSGVSMRSI